MADIKLGEPFGLDAKAISDANWSLALKRIIHDMRSDFIYAPHVGYIYRRGGDLLIQQLKSDLKAGKYLPGMPLTMEVPKSFRVRVAVTPSRLGPTYSRPGSILLPKDRLFYQALADKAAPIIKAKTDNSRTFSHRLDSSSSPNMFHSTRTCWSELQAALGKYSQSRGIRYVLRIDVANYFGSLNLHTLINVLADAGYNKPLLARLEAILTAFTGERSSRGILQGIYPSDLFGNFYMEPIDRFLADLGIDSARYVDDMYIFLPSVNAADKLLRSLIPELRRYDLVLNEAKSLIMPRTALHAEEPDLEDLFAQAVEEISGQVDEEDFDADYGFQSEWDDEDDDEEDDDDDDLELKATTLLFDSISEHPGHEENIERFCLPLFAKANSDHAVEHVIDAFSKRPSMSQIYASYLAKFLDDEDVVEFLIDLLGDGSMQDWQKMWVLAALMQVEPDDDVPVKAALQLLRDASAHDGLRAVAAIYVGRYGDAARRKALGGIYPTVSPYVQAAIYFSSKDWPQPERGNAKASWGGQGSLNSLLSQAMIKN